MIAINVAALAIGPRIALLVTLANAEAAADAAGVGHETRV